jgi:uncharacterized repeat protein (TIGR03803 family)
VALLGAVCGLITTVDLAFAQPLQIEVLFQFNDADYPSSLCLGPDGNLYGTSRAGGTQGFGQVFRVATNGEFTTLVSFDGNTNAGNPSGLTLGADGNFYGTTSFFGSASLFQVTTNGALTTMNSSDGLSPSGILTLGNDGAFYGTTFGGDFVGQETIFQVTTNGVVTTLYTFTNAWDGFGLIRSYLALGRDGNFYGTTAAGGSDDFGTVFEMATNGIVSTLCSFVLTNGGPTGSHLTLGPDGSFYAPSVGGGSNFEGSIFRVTTNGLLTTLASFADTNGTYPRAGLTLGSDGNFYGTTSSGGSSNYGTVFQVTTNGELTTLVSFVGTNGSSPGELSLGSDGNFYGTTASVSLGPKFVFRLQHGAYFQSFRMTMSGLQLNTLNVGGSGWVVLESSSNLTTWTPIQTNGTAAAQTFVDPTSLTQPRQFYRVRQK